MAPVRSAKSLKRTSSSSPSLSRNPSAASSQSADDPDPSVEDEEIPVSVIPAPTGRSIIRSFRSRVISPTSVCAISGTGRSWIDALPGTGLEAAHIVPQVHWSVYPISDAPWLANKELSVEDRPELEMAWRRTWMASNGLPLMSHLHKCFEARLISIHPQTHQIRAWVDYNVITPFHGRQAHLPDLDTDPDALQHHYDMCCLENMIAAWIPDAAVSSDRDELPVAPHKTAGAADVQDRAPDPRGAPVPDTSSPQTSTPRIPTSGYTAHPPSPPCSNTGSFRWMCGAELIDDPKEAAALLANGWLLQDVGGSPETSDGEERGRSRKRRSCTRTDEFDDDYDQARKRRNLPGADISPESSPLLR
ncbi:hypothetical protein SLS63_003493 [Diaporthe eres]|uniref:HNH nuclease domain-containing protein n=1 Tax=Diaporthe eres TaxID=83184 RepID=A0ABR1PG16_DIAER